jgi:hypothetical protein
MKYLGVLEGLSWKKCSKELTWQTKIHGWGVISGISTHLSTGSWKSIASIGSIRGKVPTSHGDTTHIK